MTLKTRNTKIIDVYDWDELVQKTYGRIYDLQQQDGCMERQHVTIKVPDTAYDFENDTIPEVVNGNEMGVSFAAWLARDPDQKLVTDDEWDREHGLDLWWQRNFYPNLQMVANDLHAKGLLEAGDYSIDIDW